MKLLTFTKALEQWMPLDWQESYDNSGLILGDMQQEIKSALLCTDLSDAVLDEAIAMNASLIISHHPPIFNGLKKLDFQTPLGKRIQKAIQQNIAWYSMHTNLDNGMEGVNSYLANQLQLENRQFLSVAGQGLSQTSMEEEGKLRPQIVSYGSGLIGDLPQKMSELEILQFIKKEGGSGYVRYSDLQNREIKKIAICGGSGNFLIPAALAQKADVFITGELKYHDFTDTDPRLWLIDFGHYESERHTKDIIYTYITKIFPTFAVKISQKDRNPVSYL
ncbi:MAG: Nif3-like dinuclear metal center hexameric protein [Bacteroidales bacterium]